MRCFTYIFLITSLSIFFFSSCEKTDAIKKLKPELVLKPGDVRLTQSIIHLLKDTTYIFAGDMNINAGQKLVIDAGTLIKVANNVEINVNAGGSIEGKGTSDNPVIFTSNAPKGSQGKNNNFWNGITITASPSHQASIILTYLRIEFSGAIGRNSLSLINVDSTAVINYVQVSYAQTASFSFNGGNAKVCNLISYAAFLSDYRLTNGFTGLMQNIIAFRHPYFPQNTSSAFAGLYIDGANTIPSVSNLSVIGPGEQSSTSPSYSNNNVVGIYVTNKAKFRIKNSTVMGFIKGAISIDNAETAKSIQFGPSKFEYNIVQNKDTNRLFYIPNNIYNGYTALDFKNFMFGLNSSNQQFSTIADFKLKNPFNYDIYPDITPSANSPLLIGADFQDAVFSDPFFKHVSYRGAIGQQDWQQDWVNYNPLQTDY